MQFPTGLPCAGILVLLAESQDAGRSSGPTALTPGEKYDDLHRVTEQSGVGGLTSPLLGVNPGQASLHWMDDRQSPRV